MHGRPTWYPGGLFSIEHVLCMANPGGPFNIEHVMCMANLPGILVASLV